MAVSLDKTYSLLVTFSADDLVQAQKSRGEVTVSFITKESGGFDATITLLEDTDFSGQRFTFEGQGVPGSIPRFAKKFTGTCDCKEKTGSVTFTVD